DDAAGELRKARPVGAELEFHGYAGNYTGDEIDTEDFGPKACSFVVHRLVGPQRKRFQHHNQGGEPHGELGKDVVVNDGEGEMDAVNKKSIIHWSGAKAPTSFEHTGTDAALRSNPAAEVGECRGIRV